MPFGASLLPAGGARFRLWAPSSPRVALQLQAQNDGAPLRLAMHAGPNGWHEIDVADAQAGRRYQFIVQTGDVRALTVPDPASRSNPQGVHGASEIVDPRGYEWRNPAWNGRSWPDAVLYELHVGTFSKARLPRPHGGWTLIAHFGTHAAYATLPASGLPFFPSARCLDPRCKYGWNRGARS